MTKKWLRLAAPAALLALGATACSSGNGAKLDAWAKTVCGGLQAPVQQSNTALADTGAVKSGETPKALQARLASDFGSLATANTGIAQAVQQAGAPATDNGAQTQADAVTELNQAAGGYTKVQQTVQSLPSGDQAKFAAGLKGVSDQVQQLAELSTAALQKLQTGDLGTALAKQPGCKSVSATAGATSATSAGAGTATGGASSTASASPSGSAAAGASAGAKASSSASASKSASASASSSAEPSASASAH
ncbi:MULTISPECIES: small secreted protein [Streptacidiphilus]|uniref:Small secreted protein n=1 Tax=Streptacidiphilus cavernicola TaxID=3342716 RepID=A0ABV6USZ4_9ACTN|nr:small secreted protein [Streptacidiphilus jeojiense]